MEYKKYSGTWTDTDIFPLVLINGHIRPYKSIIKIVEHNKELEAYLLGRFHDIDSETTFTEIIYRIVHNIEHVPHCPRCGKRIKLKSTKNDPRLRYTIFCDDCIPYSNEISDLEVGLHLNRENPQPVITDNIDDEFVLDYIISSYNKKNGSFVLKRFERYLEYLKVVQPYIYNYIINRFDDETENRMSIYIYRIINDINKVPKCIICGKPIRHDCRPGYNKLKYPAFCSEYCHTNAKISSDYLENEYIETTLEEAINISKHYNSVVGLANAEPGALACLYENNLIDECFPYREKYRQLLFSDIINEMKKYTYECDFRNEAPLDILTYAHFVNRATKGRLYNDFYSSAERALENYILSENKPRPYSEITIRNKDGYFVKKEPLTYYSEMRSYYNVRFGKNHEVIDIDVNYMIKYISERNICKHFMHDPTTGKYYADYAITSQLTQRSNIYYANGNLYVVGADAIKSISEENAHFSFYTDIIEKMMKPYPFENNCKTIDIEEFKREIVRQKWRNRYSEFFIEGSSDVINYDNKEQLDIARKWIESGHCPYEYPGCTMSPSEVSFWTFRGWSEEYARNKIKEFTQNSAILWNKNIKESEPQRYYEAQVMRPEYYIKRLGCSYEEALEHVRKLQKTRVCSLENYINRYGEEEGTRRFKERQENWQKTLKSKPDYDDIVARKSCGLFSPVSQELFDKIIEKMEKLYPGFADETHVHYATRDKEFYMRTYSGDGVLYDFVISKLKYNLEFNGEHVHPTPEVDNNVELQKTWRTPYGDTYEICHQKDMLKKQLIESKGFQQDIVWFKEYKSNPDACVNRVVSKLIQLYEKYKKSLE